MTNKKLNIHIPKIGIHYWILMILATTIGEIVGNLISRNLGLGYSTGSILLISLFILSILLIALSNKQNASFYWILIVLGNIAGTNCADFITIEPLQLGTIYGSLLVMTLLILILIIWKITSPKASLDGGLNRITFILYWFAILISSTFGTTSGDLLSNDTSLGSAGGSILLLFILFIFGLLYKFTPISRIVLYWFALVVIHPIGATIGNYISKPEGLELGNIWTSIILVSIFIILFINNNRKVKQKTISN